MLTKREIRKMRRMQKRWSKMVQQLYLDGKYGTDDFSVRAELVKAREALYLAHVDLGIFIDRNST